MKRTEIPLPAIQGKYFVYLKFEILYFLNSANKSIVLNSGEVSPNAHIPQNGLTTSSPDVPHDINQYLNKYLNNQAYYDQTNNGYCYQPSSVQNHNHSYKYGVQTSNDNQLYYSSQYQRGNAADYFNYNHGSEHGSTIASSSHPYLSTSPDKLSLNELHRSFTNTSENLHLTSSSNSSTLSSSNLSSSYSMLSHQASPVMNSHGGDYVQDANKWASVEYGYITGYN